MLDGTLSNNGQTLKNRVSAPHSLLVGSVEQTGEALEKIKQTRYPETKYLPLNAQERVMRAINFASKIDAPIQTMLNINAAHMQKMGYESVFEIGHLWDGFQTFHELLNKWLKQRNITWACVWVREYTGGKNRHHGEHWHITFHLPPKYQTALADQVAIWTGEDIGEGNGKKKCIARSLTGAWYLNKCKGNVGEYLAKAAPKTRLLYRKRVPNQHRNTRHIGGEGPIQGKRFGISRPIGDAAQRAGLAMTPCQRPSRPLSGLCDPGA